jgi:hypothetical protein
MHPKQFFKLLNEKYEKSGEIRVSDTDVTNGKKSQIRRPG